MERYIDTHNHTCYSNLRIIDSINTVERLINRAQEIGLKGLVFTEHECLSESIQVIEYQEKFPDLKLGIGNEIYLTDTRDNNQKYYHFILVAKDADGHKQLRELSSIAWVNSYIDKRMERVPTLKKDLRRVIKNNKGHVIATTACIGGELSSLILEMEDARKNKNSALEKEAYNKIISFIEDMLDIFGDDFYIEIPPGASAEQALVNKKLYQIAKLYNIKIEIACDSHYAKKEDRFVHKAYLNSKTAEREVDDFYQFAYLQSEQEILENLYPSFGEDTIKIYNEAVETSKEIYDKITIYDLRRKQIIPKVSLPEVDKVYNFKPEYPILNSLAASDNIQERYWISECAKAMKDKGFDGKKEYWERLETEADVIRTIGNKLDDCLFAYFNTFKHYIDLFWACGSIVGPGRGSSTGFLSNYLLGITQLDPIRWGLPYWRFLNKERAELPSLLSILGSCKKRTLTIA